MQADAFDQDAFFAAIAGSGARALLIGRQALVLLGAPVVTGDYDFWIHIDDIERFNSALEPLELYPNRSPEEARQRGRYVLENGERVDVLVARAQPTIDGQRVAFDDVWGRRSMRSISPGMAVAMPAISDLILTKRFGARPRDAEDIRYLEMLLSKGGSDG